MGVTYTTELGLPIPDATEIAKLWTKDEAGADDNLISVQNSILQEILDDRVPVAYTPVFKAGSTAINLGTTGSVTGWSMKLPGNLYVGGFTVLFNGTGIDTTGGFFNLTLPVAIDTTFHETAAAQSGNDSILGTAYLRDDSATAGQKFFALLPTSSTVVAFYTEFFTGKTSAAFRADTNVPITYAAGDRFAGNFIYVGAS